MIDTVRVNIKAGNGGDGCVSFLHEKYKPNGGPNGGDGGDGGSAYIVGDSSLNTLIHLKFNSTFYVDKGQHGRGKDQRGSNGKDTFIKVPIGTVIHKMDVNADLEKEFLADIVDEDPVLISSGGTGGWGNARFVSSTNQEPMLAQRGEYGESVVLFLELKLLADVGLLAKPNAGKSTLISRCSAAKPKIADYPFTTIEPVLGVVKVHDSDFVMMEVPGLIEGAHEGVGLGDQFLRHAERARLYVHLLDGMSEDPVADYHMINEELLQFSTRMAEKPQVIAVSKMDVTEVSDKREELEFVLDEEITKATGIKPTIFFISSVSGEGIDNMLNSILIALNDLPSGISLAEYLTISEDESPQYNFRSRPVDTFHIDNGVYVIHSEQLERLTARADTRDYRVLLQLWKEMTKLGIAKQLQQAGIDVGDTIRIGKSEMEWF